MPRNRYTVVGGIIAFLILANIINYIYWNWGLITVKVADAPLNKVIKSIEWQGWVTIYTNLPPDAKVTMYVDHVPLAEAMETLASSVGGRPERPRREEGTPGATPGTPNANDAATPPAAGPNVANAPTPTPGGPAGGEPRPNGFGGNGGGFGGPGVGRGARGGGARGAGGFGGGGFGGGGAEWNLAFFTAPTSAQVKAEILAFQSGATDQDVKIYNYPTPLQMVASDDDMPAADPRRQSWPGYKPKPPVDPSTAATPAAASNALNSTPATADAAAVTPVADTDTTPTVQTYLQAFAESADIWIMSPGSWATEVSSAPPPNTSIISAVKSFVSHSHGAVTQAIILRVGRGGNGGGRGGRGGGGFGGDMEAMDDRMRNAINGLPEDARPDALNQLNQEVSFYKSVQSAAPDDQMAMVRDHLMAKAANNNNNSRRSPERRAQMMQRLVSNRQAAQGQK